jgi:hypothetical protein
MKLGSVESWYRLDARFALKLLHSYINGVEEQIQSSIDRFRNEKTQEFIVYDEELRIGQSVEHFGSLDSMDVDLVEIYEHHFPNLQRRSAFLTLYAFLEYELERLCIKLQRRYKLKSDPRDFPGNGIWRSMKYMEKIALLSIDETETTWCRLKVINKLRNLLAHSDGQLNNHDGSVKQEKKILDQLRPYIDGDDEVIIVESFLPHVLEVFDKFFQYIDQAIGEKSGTE